MEFNSVIDFTEGLRSRNVELCKPSVKSVTLLNPGDLSHGIANIGGRSAGSSNVTDLTEGLRSRIAELHKPSVKSVPPLNSADLPHGIVSIGGRSVELNRVTELTEGLCSHIVECCRPSVISGTWLNSQTFRSNAAIIPLVSGITDWLAEPFIPLLVTAIVLRDCFVIDADHPEPRKGLRSLARSGGQQGGTLTSRFAKPWQ